MSETFPVNADAVPPAPPIDADGDRGLEIAHSQDAMSGEAEGLKKK